MEKDDYEKTCKYCGAPIEFLNLVPIKPCPYCGRAGTIVFLKSSEKFELHESYGLNATKLGSKKKVYESIGGEQFSTGKKKYVQKTRIFDRENNRYFEEVIDPDNGEVMHKCEEPLSDHLGHGDDKRNQR